MSISGMCLPAHAEAVRHIVSIGDGISTGAGLNSNAQSYISLIEDYTNVRIQNFAQEDATTADILTALDRPEIQKALSEADVILVNIGIHDIMDEFLITANSFMTEFHFGRFTDVFTASLAEHGFESEDELIPYANQLADAIKTNQNTAAENIQAIQEKLSAYQNAEIVWQTVYNLLDNVEMYDTLSAKRQMAYRSIMNPAGAVLNESINGFLTESAQANVHVADVYTAFQGQAYAYTNLYDLNLYPNAKGHEKIAELIIAEADLSRMGDIDGDEEIKASDAAKALEHAASIGSGAGGTLNESQMKAADVDADEEITSKDAAQILVYAAAVGSGEKYQFRTVDDTELTDPDPYQPGEELTDPDPNQPGEELTDPDPNQPDEELTDPDISAPVV